MERRYHHGDLASQLLSAALKVLERSGPDDVSLRELASELGVSRAAPYRHFANRDALLATVAARGFEDLIKAYEGAANAPGDSLDRLRALSRVYFDFARDRPGLFKLMFESEFLARDRPPAVLIGPADRAYHLLWEAVAAAYPDAHEREVKARTITMWSTIYGFLSLSGAQRIKDFMVRPLSDEEIEAAVIEAAVSGGVPDDLVRGRVDG
jgi:AcrR family transcriptional regulator